LTVPCSPAKEAHPEPEVVDAAAVGVVVGDVDAGAGDAREADEPPPELQAASTSPAATARVERRNPLLVRLVITTLR